MAESDEGAVRFDGGFGVLRVGGNAGHDIRKVLVLDFFPFRKTGDAMPGAFRAVINNVLFAQRNKGDKNEYEPETGVIRTKDGVAPAEFANTGAGLEIFPAVIMGADSRWWCGMVCRLRG